MHDIAQWIAEVEKVDRRISIIAREFAETASRIQSAWEELRSRPGDPEALDLLVEMKILLEHHALTERQDLATDVRRLFRLYPDEKDEASDRL